MSGDGLNGLPRYFAAGEQVEDLNPFGRAQTFQGDAGTLHGLGPLTDLNGGHQAVHAGLLYQGVDNFGAAAANEELGGLTWHSQSPILGKTLPGRRL